MLSKDADRALKIFSQANKRAYEDLCVRLDNRVEDHLDYLYDRYPFNHTIRSRDSLHYVVMRQFRYILYKLKDLEHQAIRELKLNNIDWLAEPYFKGERINGQPIGLSNLLKEFEHYNINNSYEPSRPCCVLFTIHRPDVRPDEYDARPDADARPDEYDARPDARPLDDWEQIDHDDRNDRKRMRDEFEEEI